MFNPPSPKNNPGSRHAGILEDKGEAMGLTHKFPMLESELFEYKYDMGFLLIDKKEWAFQYDELQQEYTKTKEALKREQEARLIATLNVEKREENLRKALGVENQYVRDLEKAMPYMLSEYQEIEFMSDSKLAEANALTISVEDKSLEVESKLHAADGKHAELSRKSIDTDGKSDAVEAREDTLRRKQLSSIAEREGLTDNISKQRKDLQERERKLQEDEERLVEVRLLLNDREERANENDEIYQKKQFDFEGEQKKTEIIKASLEKKEDDINSRVESPSLKEKEADSLRHSLQIKEKYLCELEEKLNAREQVEIQRLLDEHNATLEVKKHAFGLELEKRRKEFEDGLQSKAVEVEKKEVELNYLEVNVAEREQAIDQKHEKLKEKEKEFELMLNDLKKREKFVGIEEKKVEGERNQLLSDKQELLGLKAEIVKVGTDIEERCLQLNEESERLKITEEERSGHVRLQSELKQEIENCRLQKELLLKEEYDLKKEKLRFERLKITEEERLEHVRLQSKLKKEIENCRLQKELLLKEAYDLKQEKLRFEREWEDLNEKRAEDMKALDVIITVQKENFEKLKHSKEDRLNSEKMETGAYVQRELDALKLAKDFFAATMEPEKSLMAEKTHCERNQVFNDFELWKQELGTKLLNEKEDVENVLCGREILFDDEVEKEPKDVSYLNGGFREEIDDMKLEKSGIEREKQEVSAHQTHFDEQQLEMRKDIDELVGRSRKLNQVVRAMGVNGTQEEPEYQKQGHESGSEWENNGDTDGDADKVEHGAGEVSSIKKIWKFVIS